MTRRSPKPVRGWTRVPEYSLLDTGATVRVAAARVAAQGGKRLRHPTYDETFIICEGHYDFRLGEKLLKLGSGDVVFIPRGTPHGFVSTGPEFGRQIIISSPGGIFDSMIAEVTMLDTGSPTRNASEEAKAIAANYGLEFLPT